MEEKLEKILSAHTAVSPPYLGDASLRIDLGISSLAMVELIVDLEEAFDVEFDLGALSAARLMTVGYLAEMVEKYAN